MRKPDKGEKMVKQTTGWKGKFIFRLVAWRKGRLFPFILTGLELQALFFLFLHMEVQETDKSCQEASGKQVVQSQAALSRSFFFTFTALRQKL